MTQHVQKLIASFLALGLVLAGLVAISPVLHVALEHGGQGPAHTHGAGALKIPPGWPAREGAPRLVSTHRPFALPRIPVREFLQALGRLAAPEAGSEPDDSRPTPPTPEHDHHSLPQTLAAGGLEQSLEFVFQKPAFVGFGFLLPACPHVHPRHIFDTQTAGRAPPPSLG